MADRSFTRTNRGYLAAFGATLFLATTAIFIRYLTVNFQLPALVLTFWRELFTAFYRQVPGGVQRVSEPHVVTPDDLYGELQAASTECLVVGDGALRYRDMLEGLTKVEIADESLAYPSASSLVALAHARALREDFVQPADIKPLYLRRPDAEINWQTRPAP